MHRGWLSVNIAADWMPEAFVTSQSTALHIALHSSSKEQVTLAPQTLLIWRRFGSAAGNVGDQVGDAESFCAVCWHRYMMPCYRCRFSSQGLSLPVVDWVVVMMRTGEASILRFLQDVDIDVT